MRKSAQTVIRPDAYYTIAAANGRVLEVADFNTENGASVRLWSYEGQPWQQWQFVEAGTYKLESGFLRRGHDPRHGADPRSAAAAGACAGVLLPVGRPGPRGHTPRRKEPLVNFFAPTQPTSSSSQNST